MSQFAKQALMAKHAYVAALLAGAATLAGAQAADAPAALMNRDRAAQGMQVRHEHGRPDPARMQAFMEKRQAELKEKLKLAPEQEGNWTSFTAALKPPAMPPQGMARPDRAEFEKLSTPERIDKMRAARDQRQAAMNVEMDKRGEATKTFYSTLNAEQKKVFDAEAFRFGPPRGPGSGPGPRG